MENVDRLIQGVDAPPTDRVKAAVGEVRLQATSLTERWKNTLAQGVPALNNDLQVGHPLGSHIVEFAANPDAAHFAKYDHLVRDFCDTRLIG